LWIRIRESVPVLWRNIYRFAIIHTKISEQA
jgi:hypothetical protein